jgi:hypothetical protein
MKSFTQLVGTTTANAYPGSFCDLSQNNSTANVNLGKVLINTQHRYYLQKYFDNERTYSTLTIGAEDITLTSSPTIGSTTGTLGVAWPDITCQQLVVFGNGEQRTVTFTQGSTNIFWQTGLYGTEYATTASIAAAATSATLSTAWEGSTGALTAYFSSGESKSVTFTEGSTAITWVGGLTTAVEAYVRAFPSDAVISTIGVAGYPIPANVSKIKNDTITVGQLVYTPAPVQTIDEWTRLTALPYTSDIPAYFFIYNNVVNFWPIPSSNGNLISFNYKARVPDMTYADFSTGTVAITAGSNTVTGTGTTWNSVGTFPLNVDLSYANLYIKIDPLKGDGYWYPIQRFTSDTVLLANLPIVNAPVTSGDAYVIGQLPYLQEDFHDLLVYSSLMIYYNSIVKDKDKYALYKDLTQQREEMMKAYLGTKSVNVDLGQQPIQSNPNLFLFAPPNSGS